MLTIRAIILLILPVIYSCAGGNSSPWKPYYFDGINFSLNTANSSKAIWIRNGHFPATAETPPDPASTDILPQNTGAVAGICFLQTSGGKISERTLYSPYPDEQITLKSKVDGVYVTRTDKDGYFIEYLPTGSYDLFCRGVRTEFKVRKGETTLMPIRCGKRMAD